MEHFKPHVISFTWILITKIRKYKPLVYIVLVLVFVPY